MYVSVCWNIRVCGCSVIVCRNESYRQSFMNTGKDNAENRNPAEAECSQGFKITLFVLH